MTTRIFSFLAALATLLIALTLAAVAAATSVPAEASVPAKAPVQTEPSARAEAPAPTGTEYGEIPFTRHPVASAMAGSVHVADIDGDTDVDIVAGNRYGGQITWYENDGSQTFTPHPIPGSGEVRTVFAIDLDDDDDMDILAGDYDGITWWENEGSETFTSTLVTTDTFRARRIHAVDLDEDGDVDILGAGDSSATGAPEVAWWENDGQESFSRHVLSNAFGLTKSIYAADLDRDDDLDILAVSNQTEDVAWWENDGLESFTQHTIDGYFKDAYDVRAADVNGDGEMDVVAASWEGVTGDHSIAWWENDGQESFSLHYVDEDTHGANCVRAIDLDGDGDTDIVGGTVPQLYWWENDGSQGLAQQLIDDSIFASELETVDLDGDGDLDIVAGSADSGAIAWYEQGRRPSVVFLPLVMRNAGPVTEIPILDPIQNADGDGDYTVSWSAVPRATKYTLEEDDNPEFSSPFVRYSGSNTSKSITGRGLGTYYYRVSASNPFNTTGWSNVESVDVTVKPPCPGKAGTWSGTNNQGQPIGFRVSSGCDLGPLTIEYLVTCPGGVMWKTRTFDVYVDISDGSFHLDYDGDPTVHGSFSSTTRASGTWSSEFTSPMHCSGSGTWSATLP